MQKEQRISPDSSTSQANSFVRELREILPDYAFDKSIMSEDNEKFAKVKRVIEESLTRADRAIILMYADCGSLRKVAGKMHLSHMTLRKEVNRIREIILKEYYEE